MKTLFLLIGPKGAGKTHIGSLVEQHLGIPFLRVEPLWLSLKEGEDGWKKEEDAIHREFWATDQLMIESLGAGGGFESMRQSLANRYQLRFIKVTADLKECLRRVKTRGLEHHLPVSDDRVEFYHALAARVELPWSGVICNDGAAGEEEIVGIFRRLLASGRAW